VNKRAHNRTAQESHPMLSTADLEVIHLSREAQEQFAALLLKPPPAAAALLRALKRHHSLIVAE